MLPSSLARLAVTIPLEQQLMVRSRLQVPLALSPDGSHLVYVAEEDGSSQLYLRKLDEFEAKPMSGTDGATNPFFSPDGKWVGFHSRRKLHKVSITGGAPLTICETAYTSKQN
jgi:Tol biopolymer transport system component